MSPIGEAIRALREAFRCAKVPYDRTAYYNIALAPEQIAALQAEPDYLDFADQQHAGFFYYEGFRIYTQRERS